MKTATVASNGLKPKAAAEKSSNIKVSALKKHMPSLKNQINPVEQLNNKNDLFTSLQADICKIRETLDIAKQSISPKRQTNKINRRKNVKSSAKNCNINTSTVVTSQTDLSEGKHKSHTSNISKTAKPSNIANQSVSKNEQTNKMRLVTTQTGVSKGKNKSCSSDISKTKQSLNIANQPVSQNGQENTINGKRKTESSVKNCNIDTSAVVTTQTGVSQGKNKSHSSNVPKATQSSNIANQSISPTGQTNEIDGRRKIETSAKNCNFDTSTVVTTQIDVSKGKNKSHSSNITNIEKSSNIPNQSVSQNEQMSKMRLVTTQTEVYKRKNKSRSSNISKTKKSSNIANQCVYPNGQSKTSNGRRKIKSSIKKCNIDTSTVVTTQADLSNKKTQSNSSNISKTEKSSNIANQSVSPNEQKNTIDGRRKVKSSVKNCNIDTSTVVTTQTGVSQGKNKSRSSNVSKTTKSSNIANQYVSTNGQTNTINGRRKIESSVKNCNIDTSTVMTTQTGVSPGKNKSPSSNISKITKSPNIANQSASQNEQTNKKCLVTTQTGVSKGKNKSRSSNISKTTKSSNIANKSTSSNRQTNTMNGRRKLKSPAKNFNIDTSTVGTTQSDVSKEKTKSHSSNNSKTEKSSNIANQSVSPNGQTNAIDGRRKIKSSVKNCSIDTFSVMTTQTDVSKGKNKSRSSNISKATKFSNIANKSISSNRQTNTINGNRKVKSPAKNCNIDSSTVVTTQTGVPKERKKKITLFKYF